jgi:hypothetical protein
MTHPLPVVTAMTRGDSAAGRSVPSCDFARRGNMARAGSVGTVAGVFGLDRGLRESPARSSLGLRERSAGS